MPEPVIGLPFDFRWVSALPRNVAYRGKSGKHRLVRSISGFDPSRKQSVHRNVWCHPVRGPGFYDAKGTPSDALDGSYAPKGLRRRDRPAVDPENPCPRRCISTRK